MTEQLTLMQPGQAQIQNKQERVQQLIKLWFKTETAASYIKARILEEVKQDELWRETHESFEAFVSDLLEKSKDWAYKQLSALQVARNVNLLPEYTNQGDLYTNEIFHIADTDFEFRESVLRPLTQYNQRPDFQKEVWIEVTQSTNGRKPTARDVEEASKRVLAWKQRISKDFYTLEVWDELTEEEQIEVVNRADNKTSKFNRTNDNVEWALWTWNPVTGCLHNCDYCYARDIAIRFYEQLGDESERFKPVFYPHRLNAPANTTLPNLDKFDNPIERLGNQSVFVCSMADLFGKWVPNEWIKQVLQQAWDNPQWNFLFLTKFPIRMAEFDYPSNAWVGTTVDRQYAVERAEKAFQTLRNNGYDGISWLSCEPMLEKLTFSSLILFDWVVIGGSSKSTKTEEVRPSREWINHLEDQCKIANVPFYEKTNLLSRIREYPLQS